MRPKYMNKISNKTKSTIKLEVFKMLRNGFILSVVQGVFIGTVLNIADINFSSPSGLTIALLILTCGFLGELKK